MAQRATKRTPLMQQYFEIKEQQPNTLLLFQVGDFYELFFNDAKDAAAFLGITLTTRGTNNGEPIPLCGVPVHALEYYLVKLVRGGFRVAICDQLEEATPGKVVRRGVTQVFTPGTLTDDKLLEQKSASYLCAFAKEGDRYAVLFGELLTGQLFATTVSAFTTKELETELVRFVPDEIVLPVQRELKSYDEFFKRRGFHTTMFESTHDNDLSAQQWMEKQFSADVRKTVEAQPAVRTALYLFYAYLHRQQPDALAQCKSLMLYKPDEYVQIDASTQHNLELLHNAHDGAKKHTLFGLLDKAVTPMGSRMIKKWIARPLINQQVIEQRLDVIQQLVKDVSFRHKLEQLLQKVGDCERVIGRVALGRATVRDCIVLGYVLGSIPELQKTLAGVTSHKLLNQIASQLGNFSELTTLLLSAFDETREGDYRIKRGFDHVLDIVRHRVEKSNELLLDLERTEQEKTGINSLKIRFNNVHGYYIEVTKANAKLVPERYRRQQTLVGKERFTTDELAQLASEIITARTEIENLEREVFMRVKEAITEYVPRLRKLAQALAHLDALVGFSKVAYNQGFVRPTFNNNRDFVIEGGRHPVVEYATSSAFIPNETRLDDEHSLMIITGPNMGGKSTYLRQVALISIMAQCGSFVPAAKAQVPILDRIFTRIGAGDNVAEGKSTFLVEMEETAAICAQATQNSLVILDEVGRGTSTFDGLAIAQAVIEYLYTNVKARCLFATHYHELNHLAERFDGIVSYHAASRKTDTGIALLYKIVEGVADGSFGIEVAQLARLPHEVIARAQLLVEQFKTQDDGPLHELHIDKQTTELLTDNMRLKEQLKHLEDELEKNKEQLKLFNQLNFDDLSPRQAFDILWKYKEVQR